MSKQRSVAYVCPWCSSLQKIFARLPYDRSVQRCEACGVEHAIEVKWTPEINCSILDWKSTKLVT